MASGSGADVDAAAVEEIAVGGDIGAFFAREAALACAKIQKVSAKKILLALGKFDEVT